MDSDALFLRALEDNSLMTRSLQDLTQHQQAPPIPPKPQRMLKASSASALNYRGLARGYNNFNFPEGRPRAASPDSDIPPPIPVRSKSRDHFYHTLEYSTVDSGLAMSPQYSRRSSSLDSIHEQEEEEPQTESLFDDPRYVAVQVEGEVPEEGEGLEGRREMWRSTPSLSSTKLSRGGADRRSLRLTHVVGTQIYN